MGGPVARIAAIGKNTGGGNADRGSKFVALRAQQFNQVLGINSSPTPAPAGAPSAPQPAAAPAPAGAPSALQPAAAPSPQPTTTVPAVGLGSSAADGMSGASMLYKSRRSGRGQTQLAEGGVQPSVGTKRLLGQ